MANSGEPDQTPRSAASDLGLHCLLGPVSPKTSGKYCDRKFQEFEWLNYFADTRLSFYCNRAIGSVAMTTQTLTTANKVSPWVSLRQSYVLTHAVTTYR